MAGSNFSGGSFVPAGGDANVGHTGGVAVVNAAAAVAVAPSAGGVYTGFTVYNTSPTLALLGTIAYAPGSVPVAGDTDFIVPPNGVYSYSADRDSIASLTLGAVDPAAAAPGAYTDASALALVAPPVPVIAYVDLANG